VFILVFFYVKKFIKNKQKIFDCFEKNEKRRKKYYKLKKK